MQHEKKSLENQNQYQILQDEQEKIQKDLLELEKIERDFSLLIAKEDGGIELEKTITPQMRIDFPYKRREFYEESKKKLERLNAEKTLSDEKIDNELRGLNNFLNTKLSDRKLRSDITKSLELYQDYHSIKDWQKRILESIRISTEIAKQDLKEHSREFNQLNHQIHNSMLSVANEFKKIQNKTKIKLDGETKEMYQIQVAHWDEVKGKAVIKEYLYSILDEIKHERYQGSENASEAKKFIEESFRTKTLLRRLMEKPIKIYLRKVDGTGKLSTSFYLWERSFSWSGGEQWCKNTVLFMGILNYISGESTKDNLKTVLMDNPFGEASSDHILKPAFTIAENFGFQIIVFTAHDVRTITEYFHLIYSLKLRTVGELGEQVMDQKQEMGSAFAMEK